MRLPPDSPYLLHRSRQNFSQTTKWRVHHYNQPLPLHKRAEYLCTGLVSKEEMVKHVVPAEFRCWIKLTLYKMKENNFNYNNIIPAYNSGYFVTCQVYSHNTGVICHPSNMVRFPCFDNTTTNADNNSAPPHNQPKITSAKIVAKSEVKIRVLAGNKIFIQHNLISLTT